MSRQDSQQQMQRKQKSKVFPISEVSAAEMSAPVIATDVTSAELPQVSGSLDVEDKNGDSSQAWNDAANSDKDNNLDLEKRESWLSTYSSVEPATSRCGDGESSKTKETGDDDSNSSYSGEVILVDEVHNKGGVITRSKAKSVGQVDYASTLRRRQGKSPKTFRKAISEEAKLNEIQAEDLERRLKALAAAFTARTIRTKKKIQQPPTPSSAESDTEETKIGEPTLLDRLRQLASPDPSEFGDSRRKSMTEKMRGTFARNLSHLSTVLSCDYILDPQSSVYIGWLLVVGIVFLYNAWMIPLRVVFPYQTEGNMKTWIALDCLADVVYLIDLVAFKPHVKFIQNGFWVKEPKETLWTYLRTIQFKLDVVALSPVDMIVTIFGQPYPLLRLPRLLKVHTFWELFRQLDTYLAHPHRARIFHTCLYMLYMIHMVACSYYALSTWEGIGTTTWTFDGHGNAYIRCFYFATKTATSIGKNPKPENELEYIFMTFAWLSGVFGFAILIGQIRDIIATATKSQTEYRILTSATISYLHRLGVPRRLQDRVKLWLSYTWEQQKTLDETRILNLLPKNMKAEIALNIHVETLAKVKLFQNCETAFLRDLVVKLRSIIILPGDFVCRKGEIGREMFIVKSGKIHVIGGPSGTQVLATLCEGSVFGEIALLGIGGMNKRTADVRAAGFANLFVLNKGDLNDVIRDYPEAQEIMQKKAKRLMRENIKKARATPSPVATSDDCASSSIAEESGVIIKNKPEPPQLISTMLKLFPPTTKIGRYLTQGSKVGSSTESIDKPLDAYTSVLTSYPPSPFIPTSPGHISPELDISIMTGDSSEKMLSPPPESQQDIDDELTFSSEDGYRSDQLDGDGKKEHVPREQSFILGQFEQGKVEQQMNSLQAHGKTAAAEPLMLPRASSDELHTTMCTSPDPLSQFESKPDISTAGASYSSDIPDIMLLTSSSVAENDEKSLTALRGESKDPEKSCSHFDSVSSWEANRDKIPIERRPPLYIIEPHVHTPDGKSETVTVNKRKMRLRSLGSRDVFGVGTASAIDSFPEDDLAKNYYDTKNKTHDDSKDIISTISDKSTENNEKVDKASASSSALTASHFISRIRRPLKRQPEVTMEFSDESSKVRSADDVQSKEQKQGTVKSDVSLYSLDLDSD